MPRFSPRTLPRLLTALVALLSLGVLFPAPALSVPRPVPHRSAAVVTVEMRSFAFIPPFVTVQRGDSVRWVNNEDVGIDHTATSDGPGWDSGRLTPGQSFTHVFETPGVFSYHCALHSQMTGTVTVR
ncbi:cupredoxin family copper-binding protein [Streptomyces stramineus]|uniref:Blue (type 1) copper domain-containing protein n=2 Tax=Streptomyces stramineus TaxID=173861 RepID=A0ABP3L2S9_9ACTN